MEVIFLSFTFHQSMNMKEGGEASGEAINHFSIFLATKNAFAAAGSVDTSSFLVHLFLLVFVC